jgi:D-glycero-D-manno-heptose 1,7-bisphosphate phosphatase
MKRFVFLDRDGTINVGPAPGEYLVSVEEVRLLPGAATAICRLNAAGAWVGIVTNQRGVALGRMSMASVEAVNDRVLALLATAGARVDGVWVCPHGEGECECRKPAPGLLLQAQGANPRIDFAQAAMIGDSVRDVGAGRAVGALTIGIGDAGQAADHAARDLADAVDWLLRFN